MEHPCMLFCRFPTMSKASRTESRRYPLNYSISPLKVSIPILRGNNPGLFSVTPLIFKRDRLKVTVSATYSPAFEGGGMEEEKRKNKMQPKGPVSDEVQGLPSILVERDRSARSLGQKLEVIRDLVAENIDNGKRLEALTYSAIYLKWISTGKIPSSENGGSDQRNKCNEISRHIFSLLERICSRKDVSVQESLVIRMIHRCLISFKEFTTSVPITRLEDVAHQELEDFFNAGCLVKQLGSIKDSLDQSSAAVPQFLSKQQLDNIAGILGVAEDELMKRSMNVLQALDILRQEILKCLEIEQQTCSPDSAFAYHRMWRLCEIRLEDYSSLLLSRFLDSLESVGGAHWLSENVEQKNASSWSEPLGALVISIHQLGLSGWKPEECRAIRNELIAWQKRGLLETEGGEDGTRIWGLRLKATLERVERLTEDYSQTLLNIYSEKVQILGEAFEILEIGYAESEIRADVIFQVSNLCTLLVKAVRKVIKARGFDILVPGTAFGKLIQVENLVSIPSTVTEPLIVVVNKSEGDEEVEEAGEAGISGVILLQGLPRLSRLVFWARKKNIVVMACEDEDEVLNVRNLNGEVVRLVASSHDVSFTPHSLSSLPSFTALPSAVSNEIELLVKASEIYTEIPKRAMRVEDAEKNARTVRVQAENICGKRAAACCRLASLAAESIQVKNENGVSASFKVPKGAVLPFGSINAALDRDEAKRSRYGSLLESLGRASGRDEDGGPRHELHELVSSLSPSEEAIKELLDIFRDDVRVITLRPSASFEDFRGDDEHVLNASISDPIRLGYVVSRVWASLFTPGALRSLRAANVNVKDADVAVLAQEMLPSDLSFVLRIFSPVVEKVSIKIEMEGTGDLFEVEIKAPNENEDPVEVENETKKDDDDGHSIAMEIAPGLREARARVMGGNPWRLSYGQPNGTVETLAFANLSKALVSGGGGGEVVEATVDYSEQRLTTDPRFRQDLGRRLGAVGCFLAKKFRGRWNVVGCVIGEDIYVEQILQMPH